MAKYTQISVAERYQININLIKKEAVKSIAKALGRHRSSIYRELNRNKQNGIYDPATANKLARERPAGGAKAKIETSPEIKEYVLEKLNLYWSPEEISGRIKREKQNFSVCMETIYQFVYRDKTRNLYKLLPNKRNKRSHRHQRKKYKTAVKSAIIAACNIKHRPAEALSRHHSGHWEGDTIRFPNTQKTCVTTLVERKSRYIFMAQNEDGKTNTVIGAICDIIKNSSKDTWKTLTFDQGTEFMGFQKIKRFTSCTPYFCDPHSPWQRPTNENTNGRIRRFLPKNFPIDSIVQTDLDVISELMNNTPRKCLGYQTPKEVLMQLPCRT